MTRIYLDYQATTPVDPAVLAAMLPYFSQAFGNPASRAHAFGQEADEAVERARGAVASVLSATPDDIIFTSGATESINLALKGVAGLQRAPWGHLITTQTEHPATLDACRALEAQGHAVTYVPVDGYGRVDPAAIEAALRPDTCLISVIHGNNEVGTLNPIAAIGRLARARGVAFHLDAAQTFGRVPLDVNDVGADLVSVSGHKIYAPKGVGALYVRQRNPRVRLAPQLHGGGHERGMRSGTLNVPGIVGLGMASAIAQAGLADEARRTIALRDRLLGALAGALTGITLNGHPTERLPGNLNLSFALVDGEALMTALAGVAISTGSACSSASLLPSHVLKACGLGDLQARASVRFGLGRFTTADEVDAAARLVIEAVQRLRARSPLYALWQAGIDLAALGWPSPGPVKPGG